MSMTESHTCVLRKHNMLDRTLGVRLDEPRGDRVVIYKVIVQLL